MAFLPKAKCYNCGKAINENEDVRVKSFRDKVKYVLIHKKCKGKIPDCCVCGDKGTSIFRGVGNDLYPTCDSCKRTIIYLDDCMDTKREVIKEAKRMIFGEDE